MLKDYRVEIKVKNNWLWQAMVRAGFLTASALADAAGVPDAAVGRYLNLAVGARLSNGEWRQPLMKIAAVLKMLPEDLFPPQHHVTALARNKAAVEMSYDDMLSLSSSSPELLVDRHTPEDGAVEADVKRNLEVALGMLGKRERGVLELRFGIGVDAPKTLEEIARMVGVTRERVRQIEAKALRKIKHPQYTRRLRESMPDA